MSTILGASLHKLATIIINTLLPPRCAVSGDLVDVQGMIAPKIWSDLDFIGDPVCAVCGFPFDFEMEEAALCGSCLEKRPPFETARAALKYNDSSRGLILGFKHGDKTHAVRAFVPWMKSAGSNMLAQADFIVPVPLHRWRLLSRRYNQSAILALALSKECGVPVIVDGLVRTRATPVQGHLKAAERHANVKNAFAVNPKRASALQGKTIVLIDDVFTTGATLKECTKTLLKGGAARVHVLTLARALKE